jgi:tetratricopeptide (TPR) repeat protein/TolB-like protein/tRNA A-37 threonylcarbamoyl transferase component Bud32
MGNPRMEPASAVTSAVTSVADLSGTTVGRFAIHELLGKGGMGEVYRASDTRLKRQVALKRIAPNHRNDEHSRDRLWKEAEWASRLSDSHIAAVYDVIEEENELFIVMEYVDGQTFRRRLAKPIPVAEFLPIATECALALAAAHKAGVLHRDIKPENIMLTTSGHVKVLDFGVAKNLPGGIEIKTLSTRASAEFAGTLIYMAPEVVQEKDSDARADIFSLGIVFYETIAGCNPFRAETFLETCNRILYHEPLPSHELNPTSPAELDRIVAKMIAKDPAQRYSTAADLAVDLNSLQLTLSQSGVAVPQRLPVPKRKRTVMWATGLTAAFLAATAFIAPVRQQFKSWLSASPMPHAKQVAVLPFSIVGGDAQTAALGAGLAETLTAKLTQLTSDPSLQVVPATEIRAKHITTVDDARKEFGANLVLEGSLHKSGQQIRVNYILVDARTRRQMRAESVTLAEVDSFAAEDAVVNGAIQMLELEIRGGQRQALENHGTEVAGAYDYYLQGRGYLQNYDRVENLDSAIQVFERALTLDRNYALAYAGLGDAYWKKYSSSKEPAWIEKSRTACQQANHLDGKMSSAYACLGTLSSGTGNYQEAAQEFGRAAESEPTNDGAFRGLADAYEHLGKLEEAEKTYRRAIELRPHYWAGYNWLGVFYYRKARFGEASEMFNQVVALAPDSFLGYSNLGAAFVEQARYADAIVALERSIAIRPYDYGYTNLGNAYFFLRRYEEADRAYEQATKLAEKDSLVWWNLGDGYYWTPGKRGQAASAYRRAIAFAQEDLRVNPKDGPSYGVLAICHAMLGEKKPAYDALQRGLRLSPADPPLLFQAALVNNQFGQSGKAIEWLKKAGAAGFSSARIQDYPNFDSLRTDHRFQGLLREK